MLIGNLGTDAETRFTTNNISVSSYPVATNRSYKNKDGEWVNETTWHQVVSFNLPDGLKEALKKGKKIYVEGRLSKRDYTDKDGIKRYVTEVVSERIIPLESKDSDSSSSEPSQTYSGGNSGSNEDDDLPF
jgi:single-strand DNA-binding protein